MMSKVCVTHCEETIDFDTGHITINTRSDSEEINVIIWKRVLGAFNISYFSRRIDTLTFKNKKDLLNFAKTFMEAAK